MDVGVVGMGRFGRLFAGMLSKKFHVRCYDQKEEVVTPAHMERASLEKVLRSSYVFLCVPISSFRNCLEQIAPLLEAGTVLIDTCSVKVYPVQCMETCMALDLHLIASHPLFGPDSASNVPLPMVVYNLRASQEVYEVFKEHMSNLGMDIIEMNPQEHDKVVALTQGVTHVIGRVLHLLSLPETPAATLGYQALQDIVRQTCNDSLELFMDLQRYNPFTEGMRNSLSSAFQKIDLMISEAGIDQKKDVE